MQQYSFTLTAHHRPETLERILRVVRHRGFTVLALNAEVQGAQLLLSLRVASEREFDLLKHQLVKLIDVVEIR